MVNDRASRGEIEALASDGWRFRKKPRKGILYVSARSGTKERSLGRHSDEYWAMIEDVIKSLTDRQKPAGIVKAQLGSKEVTDPLILVMDKLERNMKIHVFMQCLYQEADHFCGYWLLEDLPRYGKQLSQKDLEYEFKEVNGVDVKTSAWAFKPTVGICSICPSFKGIKYKSRAHAHGILPNYIP